MRRGTIIMKKKPFVTLDKLREIEEQFPTPFHLYDEKGIRENARALVKKLLPGIRALKSFLQ